MARSIALALALLAAGTPALAVPGDGSASAILELNARARAAGNRKADATALARALLAQTWPAQILKVRIDGAGSHEVAGLLLSGVKFHRRLTPAAFTDQVIALVGRSFASSAVEEVDVWAVTPLRVSRAEVQSGDYLQPTARVVYSATVRRAEGASFAARLRRGDGVFWDAAWRNSL
jgi:hypothetical protein